VSASAIGYYGSRGDEVLTESSPPGDDFLARLTQSWELSALAVEDARRVVVLRFGTVLAADGGALAEMIPPFKLFVGGPVGSGAQWMSWIDRDDAIAMIRWAITNPDARGAFNATAPNPVRNREFAKELGRALHRPSLVRAPAFALRSAFGEMADALLLSSARVLPQRAVEAGFQFRVPDLSTSLAHVMSLIRTD
jgi:TIGR01777 family protein